MEREVLPLRAEVLPKIQHLRAAALVAVLVVLLLMSFPRNSLADKFDTSTAYDAREYGMGMASVNLGRGAYAMFSNPANIVPKETTTNFQLVNLQLDTSDGFYSAINNKSGSNFLSLADLKKGLDSYPNTFVGGRYSVFPNVTLRYLSFGLLYEVNQGAMVRAGDKALYVKARNRFAPVAAASFRLLSGILRFGASAQMLTVGNANTYVSAPVNPAISFSDVVRAGSALVMTGGMTLTLPFRYLPSFSVVLRNIGDSQFAGTPAVAWGKGGQPADMPMSFDYGSSMTVYLGRRLEAKLAFDYRDVSNQYKGGPLRHMFMGTELIAYDMLKLRAGMAHGYWTFGAGINTPKASIDIAAYADEMDDRLRGSKEQRFVLQYSWGLFR